MCMSSTGIVAFSRLVDFGDFLELQCIPWALQVGFSFPWIPSCLAVIEGREVRSPPTGGAKMSCYSLLCDISLSFQCSKPKKHKPVSLVFQN